MKKRKYLILLLILLMAISSSFSIVASAYTIRYDKEDGEDYYKDSLYYHSILGWDNIYEIKESQLASGPFYMLPGAAVSAVEENILCFTLFCKEERFVQFKRNGDILQRYFSISLLRQSEKNLKYTEESSYNITYSPVTDTLSIINAQDELLGGANPFTPVLSLESENFEELKDFGFKKVDANLAKDYGWKEGDFYLRLYWKVDSVHQKYRVLFKTSDYYYVTSDKKFLGIKVGEERELKSKDYMLLSDIRSYYDVLDKINQVDKIEEEFTVDMRDYVYDVLSATEQNFTVEYLENIGKTPFARKVQKQVTVKAMPDTLKLSSTDVAAALGVTNVNCLLSACKGFARDTKDDIFKASYYESVYLNAKTVDGKSMNYILDPNKSYYDYFNKMDKDNIISSDMMGYCYNEMLRTYPELEAYSMQEVYGYFGYIVLPDTFTVNQAFAMIFGNELEFDGTVNMVTFKDTLTVESYNKLLQDYDYPWLSVVWNTVWGALTSCNATHVMLYADCTKTKAYETLNGSPEIDNTNGLLVNRAPEVLEDIVVDITEKTKNLTSSFLNSLFGDKNGKTLVVVLVIGLAIIVVIKILNKPTIRIKTEKSKKRRNK